jgi:hypothetical protein
MGEHCHSSASRDTYRLTVDTPTESLAKLPGPDHGLTPPDATIPSMLPLYAAGPPT